MDWNIWTWSSSFLSAHELAWQAFLKKTEVELETSNVIHRFATENNKYMRIFDKDSSCLFYLDGNNLYGLATCRKLPVNDFKWKKYVQIQWKLY